MRLKRLFNGVNPLSYQRMMSDFLQKKWLFFDKKGKDSDSLTRFFMSDDDFKRQNRVVFLPVLSNMHMVFIAKI